MCTFSVGGTSAAEQSTKDLVLCASTAGGISYSKMRQVIKSLDVSVCITEQVVLLRC